MDVQHRGFVFPDCPTEMCHASTCLPLPDGRVLSAWFGGSVEGENDVAIWMSVREGGRWSAPCMLARGEEAHWNPVLLQQQDGGIAIFYKVGRDIAAWRTMVCHSVDGGRSWTAPVELVAGDRGGRGPVRNKVIRATGGRLLAPASLEKGIWRAFVDFSDDNGATWTSSNAIGIEDLQYRAGERTTQASEIAVSEQSFHGRGVIQPTLWQSQPGMIHMLLRSSQGRIYRSDSQDNGKTWCQAYPTELPNNNSGIDLDRTGDGTLALVCNPVGENWGPRTPVALAVSQDNGGSWQFVANLEEGEGEFSYPCVVATDDLLHITYTWKRRRIAYWQIKIHK